MSEDDELEVPEVSGSDRKSTVPAQEVPIAELDEETRNALREAGVISEGEGDETVALVSRHAASMHRGPIPSPRKLREYGQIDPNYPDRIFDMTENDLEHEQDVDRRKLQFNETERENHYSLKKKKANQEFWIKLGGIGAAVILTIVAAALLAVAVFQEQTILAWLAGGILVALTGSGAIGNYMRMANKSSE